MECIACTRSDYPARHYYCTSCLKSRLVDHQARKQQLRNALTLQANRANSVLVNGPSSSSVQPNSSRSRPLGVREESELKAQRWTLSVKLRDTRIATEQEKAKVETLAAEVQNRRFALQARRKNLSTARSLLTSLSSPSHPSSPSLPLSLPSLTARLSQLSESLSTLSDSLSRVRRILTLELLTTFSFKSIESPLPDPFILHPSPSTPFPPSYSLATLPLPPLSLLPTLPVPTLEALLVNLSHLTRLLALYETAALPFVPLPNCYGPGRAGIKKSRGFSDSIELRTNDKDGTTIEETDEPTVVCWPLGFGGGTEKSRVASARNGTGTGEIDLEGGGQGLPRRSTTVSSNRKGASTDQIRVENEATVSSKRFKLVMTGAIAIAFDLAYITSIRESREAGGEGSGGGERLDWDVNDLEDLGKLICRAAGAETLEDREKRRKDHATARNSASMSSTANLDPFPALDDTALSSASLATIRSPAELSTPPLLARFPLAFSTICQHYLALAFASSTTVSKGGAKKRRTNGSATIGRGTRLGESSFVDAGISTIRLEDGDDGIDEEAEVEAEEGEEEEWDFV